MFYIYYKGNFHFLSKEKRPGKGEGMTKIEIPLTPEHEETLLLGMIKSKSLFMDITFPEYPSQLTALDIMFREAMQMEINVREAVPGDIPHIREFFDTLKLIEEGSAK